MYSIQMPCFDFKGKTAVVTGAGSGIGRAAALELAYYGANVVVADISASAAEATVAEITENGGSALAWVTDVSQSTQVDALVAATVERFGSLDIFISNAGVGGDVLPLLEQSEEEFERVLSVNLKGAFLCGKAAAKQMITQGKGGRIIITASIAAIEGGGFHGPYGASKGGIVTLVRTMGRGWAQYGITVNAVSPGLTATGINETLAQDPELLESLLDKIPLHRMAKPEEIASLMLYLATDSAAFITATTMIADGGATTGG